MGDEHQENPNANPENVEENVELLFAGKKKKKKKKKEEAPVSESAPVIEQKEESKEKVETAVEDATSRISSLSVADDLTELPKKKKKKKKDLATFEKELGDFFGFSLEKTAVIAENDHEEIEEEDDSWKNSDRDYTYEELLERAFNKIKAVNPDYGGEKRKYVMVPPDVARDGVKKTLFSNLEDICKRMHRNQDHVTQFLFAELGTSGAFDGNNRLVIKGRFQQKQIETVLRRYIVEYVTCKICKSPQTILTKENRLHFVQCEVCGSNRSVAQIKSGFSAQVGRRKK